jgi:flagellin
MAQSFSVVNNLQSVESQRNLYRSNLDMNKVLSRISSGLRINDAADDAAGLAIANGLSADSMALNQAYRNAGDGIGIVQIADGSLSKVSDMLSRATSLATQAASGTMGAAERQTANTEYQQILGEIDRVVDTANFKGEKLFSQTGSVRKEIFVGDTHVGSSITVSVAGASGAGTKALGLAGTTLNTAADAAAALAKMSGAIQEVSQWRGALGAQENRIINAIGIIGVQNQNLMAAESTIRDANMAEEMTGLTRNRILLESGMASLAQANMSASLVMSLFR